MCGRFSLSTAIDLLAEHFEITEMPENFMKRYNIAPTQPVVVISTHPERRLDFFRWGLIPSWAKDPSIGNRIINARAETIAEKPSFKRSFKKRRCLILADGFFEWKKEGKVKMPIHIRLKSKEPFAFAGLWDIWHSPDGEVIPSCTIITCEPNSLLKKFHHRMPVILTPDSYDAWLDHKIEDTDELLKLLKPYSAKSMEAFEVSTVVNSPARDLPECILPITEKRI